MKYPPLFVVLLLVLSLIACSSATFDDGVMRPHEKKDLSITHKKGSSSSHGVKNFVPLEDSDFLSIKSWYSDSQFLYVRSEAEKAEVMIFDVYTGDKRKFLETINPITQIVPSPTKEYFAIETKDNFEKSIVLIVDKQGDILFEKPKTSDYVEFSWSPYEESDIIITYYLPNFTTLMEVVNIVTDTTEVIDVQPYVQWYDKNTVAHFKWSSEPSLSAPIHLYNLETQETSQLVTNALVFTSNQDSFMYVQERDTGLSFHFFKNDSENSHAQFEIPKLDTHAGYIWTPFFKWVQYSNEFYTFEPKDGGSVLGYEEGFSLISFDINTGTKREVVEVESLTQIDCTNDGKLCLVGYQLENLVSTDSGNITSIVKTK
ncbi:hypothetical protein HNQ94_002742 [Salirhabdus euzebyi]|uniref:YqgU-like 6-bladed beta-propeller domain-containing protein n=1 Tax=Salirhabdus euzebyi TaxID=394506 RepID=A0A841Q7H2_9BACI|nr:hypothetical protein [Salirhabdus euzebyi]MBB6454267.1 hypothetical protein [Salirhabdus euzebyi]